MIHQKLKFIPFRQSHPGLVLLLFHLSSCYCAGSNPEESCVEPERSVSFLSSTTESLAGDCPNSNWIFELSIVNEHSEAQAFVIDEVKTILKSDTDFVVGTFPIPLTEINLSVDSIEFDGAIAAEQQLVVNGQATFNQGLGCDGGCFWQTEMTGSLGGVAFVIVSDAEEGSWPHTECYPTEDQGND